MSGDVAPPSDFIREIIDDDLRTKKHGRVATRFPPEPNGYLHIGHAKSVCLNFGIGAQYGGTCNLRMDDTDPSGESLEFVESIITDVRWLGFDWDDRLFYASDYYERLYGYAVKLISKGLAYVCDLTPGQIREYRGTLTEPGKESPFRTRPIDENLDLFSRMRAGEFEDGSRVLRAKIDMASKNVVMRGLPIRSAPSNLKTTGPSTIGCWNSSSRASVPNRSNLPASMSATRSSASAGLSNWSKKAT